MYFVLFFCFFTGLCSVLQGAATRKGAAADGDLPLSWTTSPGNLPKGTLQLEQPERTERPQTPRKDLHLRILLTDSLSNRKLDYAYVLLSDPQGRRHGGSSSENGLCILENITPGPYRLQTSLLGYKNLDMQVSLHADSTIVLKLSQEAYVLDDVVVTATESRRDGSASVIDQKAMQHLQPSSFTDLLELLPGNVAQGPVYGSSNFIRLREAANAPESEDYSIGSLGTLFVIDDVPVPTSSTLETVIGESGTYPNGTASSRFRENRGVDMRSISTDQIEQVEIVRGIPSAEYGDLTSGLVKIKRKMGGKDWNARFKADTRSKLFYIGKGLEFKERGLKMNLGVDYLDAKIDPRNRLENYKRATASFRLEKHWTGDVGDFVWNNSLDYGGNFDMEENDPDLDFTDDRYHRSSQSISWNQGLRFLPGNQDGFWKNMDLDLGLHHEFYKTEIKRLVQPNRPLPVPNSMEEGEHEASYLASKYTAYYTDEGRPFDLFLHISSDFEFNLPDWTNHVKTGIEYKYGKNFGDGPVFDLEYPLNPTTSLRPRAYKSIPGIHTLAFYVQDRSVVPVGSNRLEIMLGIRGNSLPGLSRKYAMRGKVYWDPRLNADWVFPALQVKGRPMQFSLGAGIGIQSKMPTLAHLYPDMIYNDLVEINYFHSNSEWRYILLKTFITDPTPYDIVPARNLKWEVRIDGSYAGNRLSVTYFRENMDNAFRSTVVPQLLHYTHYDITSIEPGFEGKPTAEQFAHYADTAISYYTTYGNNSSIRKQGVEFQFSSQRIEAIRTRFTFNGAWFRSFYGNNEPVFIYRSVIVDNEALPYIGLYEHDGDMRYEQFYTNLMIDTDIPRLGLGFSISLQCQWLQTHQTVRASEEPFAYMDLQGRMHPWTEACRQDMYLQYLDRNFASGVFVPQEEHFSMSVNLKVTKAFLQGKLRLALFVNGIAYCAPPYYVYGVEIKRRSTPYFGMELNFRI